jgi:hypothetical protein
MVHNIPSNVYLKHFFRVNVPLTPLPAIYTLYGEGSGIRTQVSFLFLYKKKLHKLAFFLPDESILYFCPHAFIIE